MRREQLGRWASRNSVLITPAIRPQLGNVCVEVGAERLEDRKLARGCDGNL